MIPSLVIIGHDFSIASGIGDAKIRLTLTGGLVCKIVGELFGNRDLLLAAQIDKLCTPVIIITTRHQAGIIEISQCIPFTRWILSVKWFESSE